MTLAPLRSLGEANATANANADQACHYHRAASQPSAWARSSRRLASSHANQRPGTCAAMPPATQASAKTADIYSSEPIGQGSLISPKRRMRKLLPVEHGSRATTAESGSRATTAESRCISVTEYDAYDGSLGCLTISEYGFNVSPHQSPNAWSVGSQRGGSSSSSSSTRQTSSDLKFNAWLEGEDQPVRNKESAELGALKHTQRLEHFPSAPSPDFSAEAADDIGPLPSPSAGRGGSHGGDRSIVTRESGKKLPREITVPQEKDMTILHGKDSAASWASSAFPGSRSPAAARRRRRRQPPKNRYAPTSFERFMLRKREEEKYVTMDNVVHDSKQQQISQEQQIEEVMGMSRLDATHSDARESVQFEKRSLGLLDKMETSLRTTTELSKMNRPGTKERQETASKDPAEFSKDTHVLDCKRLVALTKKYPLPACELLNMWRTWVQEIPANQTVEYLSLDDFKDTVRRVCGLEKLAKIPTHLLQKGGCPVMERGFLTFEEFVQWSIHTAFAEEVVVRCKKERELRSIARDFDMTILDIESVQRVFNDFDTDGSGEIEEDEFRKIVLKLMKVKNESDLSERRLERYWRDVDTDGGGSIGFVEFLCWYTKEFPHAISAGRSAF